MTAVIQASMAAAESFFGTVITVGNSGANFGFRLATFGAGPATFRGVGVDIIDSEATLDFAIRLTSSPLAQNFISRVQVDTTAGPVRNYLGKDATFTSLGGFSLWTWGTGASKVWTATSVGKTLFIYY